MQPEFQINVDPDLARPAGRTVLSFVSLAAISAVMGAYVPSLGIEGQGAPGIAMVLTGVWFGLALAAGMVTCGYRSPASIFAICLAIFVGWQAAFNIAFFIAYSVNNFGARSDGGGELVGGFIAGAIGAAFTWVGVAYAASGLRTIYTAIKAIIVGAVLGLLLHFVPRQGNLLLLLLPWQMGVAGILGQALAGAGAQGPDSGSTPEKAAP